MANSFIDPITDSQTGLNLRIEALNRFIGRVADIVSFLSKQLELELDRDDTGFVVYLLGAIGSIYDRRTITTLIKLLQTKDIELIPIL